MQRYSSTLGDLEEKSGIQKESKLLEKEGTGKGPGVKRQCFVRNPQCRVFWDTM